MDPPRPYISILRDGQPTPLLKSSSAPALEAPLPRKMLQETPSVPALEAQPARQVLRKTPCALEAQPARQVRESLPHVRTLVQCPFCMVLYLREHNCPMHTSTTGLLSETVNS